MKHRRSISVAVLVIAAAVSAVLFCHGASTPAAPKVDNRVKDILDKLKLKYDLTELNNFRVNFGIKGKDGKADRSHWIFIASNTETYRGYEIRKIWGVAYKTDKDLPADLANNVLIYNVLEKMGAWEFAKREDGNRLKFVVRIAANCTSEAMDAALHSCLFTADSLEEKLSGEKDEF